jgi:hypothetical protein
MVREVGKDRLVLDLSCRRLPDGGYAVVTDRWQKFTELRISHETLDRLSSYCDEFLIHAADVEGKRSGVEKELVKHIPDELIPRAHHWLILHGRYVCKSQKPKCGECGIRAFCKEGSKHQQNV